MCYVFLHHICVFVCVVHICSMLCEFPSYSEFALVRHICLVFSYSPAGCSFFVMRRKNGTEGTFPWIHIGRTDVGSEWGG